MNTQAMRISLAIHGLLLILALPSVAQVADPSPEMKLYLATNADIATECRRYYFMDEYPYANYMGDKINAVRRDLYAIEGERDEQKFVDLSKKLKQDFDVMDQTDDSFRVGRVI